MSDTLKRELNRVRLVDPGTGEPGHFALHEFQNSGGLVCVQPSTLWCLERVHEELRAIAAPATVAVIVSDAIRTDEDLESLAAAQGWIGETAPDGSPGNVSRDSTHLVRKFASGVDFYARIGERGNRTLFPMAQLARIAEKCFDHVILYKDHVHGDNRNGCTRYVR